MQKQGNSELWIGGGLLVLFAIGLFGFIVVAGRVPTILKEPFPIEIREMIPNQREIPLEKEPYTKRHEPYIPAPF